MQKYKNYLKQPNNIILKINFILINIKYII